MVKIVRSIAEAGNGPVAKTRTLRKTQSYLNLGFDPTDGQWLTGKRV